MTIRHMKIFLEVYSQESITKAADSLYISQPAVSAVIKELEDHYGRRLFDRISNRLYLTGPGQDFYDYASNIIFLFDEMETKMTGSENTGKLRVGSSITIGTVYMPSYLASLKEKYPNIEVYITIDSSDVIENKILRNELDIALIEGIVHSDSIIKKTYMDDELSAVCSPTHPFAAGQRAHIEDFLSQPFLLRERGSGTRELFDDTLASLGYSVVPRWESTSTAALINAVGKGIGVSVLPRMLVCDKIKQGTLREFDPAGLRFKRSFNIVYHKNKYLSSAAQTFIDICEKS